MKYLNSNKLLSIQGHQQYQLKPSDWKQSYEVCTIRAYGLFSSAHQDAFLFVRKLLFSLMAMIVAFWPWLSFEIG